MEIKNVIIISILILLYFIQYCSNEKFNSVTSVHTTSAFISQSSLVNSNLFQENYNPFCSCGVFLTGQFTRNKPPVGNPVILHELEEQIGCNPMGIKQCINRCIEGLVKYLPNSPSIVCGSIDRDCYKERAYLFVKNCDSNWTNTNLSAGKEYCCKDGLYSKCPNNRV